VHILRVICHSRCWTEQTRAILSEVKAYGEGKEVAVLPPTLLLTATYSLLYNSCCVRKLDTSFIQDPSL
jgi:hypothetical protein